MDPRTSQVQEINQEDFGTQKKGKKHGTTKASPLSANKPPPSSPLVAPATDLDKTMGSNKAVKGSNNENDAWSIDIAGDVNTDPNVTLPIPKTELLSFVQTLSLASHHESACDCYANSLTKFLTALDTLRVVETPSMWAATFFICENIPHGNCPILEALVPRKLVVRNVTGNHLPVSPGWSVPRETEEVVLFLSTVMDRLGKVSTMARLGKPCYCNSTDLKGVDGPKDLIDSYQGQFSTVKKFEIVFWPDLDMTEVNHRPDSQRILGPMEAEAVHREKPIYADHIARILRVLTYGVPRLNSESRPLVTVYGFGQLHLIGFDHSTLVRRYKTRNPNLATYDLATIVKQNASMAHPYLADPRPFMVPCEVQWRTIDSYKRNIDDRKAKVSEFD